MAKPVLFAIDDDPEVLRAVDRDLRRQYGEIYRVMRASSGPSALEALEQLKAKYRIVEADPQQRDRGRQALRRQAYSLSAW